MAHHQHDRKHGERPATERPQPRTAPEHAGEPSDATPPAAPQERDYGANAEQVTDQANFREDDSPPGEND